MTLTDAIASYKNYLKTEYPRSIPTTDAELVRNSLLYLLANKDGGSITSVGPTPSTPVDGTVGTTAVDVATAKSDRTSILIHNHSTSASLLIHCGQDAKPNSGLFVLHPERSIAIEGVLAGLRISAVVKTRSGSVNYTAIELLETTN